MTTPYSASLHDVVEAVVGKLRGAHVELGLTDKYPEADRYGVVFGVPEAGLPYSPFVVVDALAMQSEVKGASFYSYVDHHLSVMYGFCDWKGSSTGTRLEALRRAHLVYDLLHEDLSLDNKVVFGYVTSVEPAVMTDRGGGVFGFELSWQGLAVATLQEGANNG